ncbi:DUF6364 family protein [Bifidobacterium sp. SO1]|uniref:DUF6364 family protein n=1 Tax=Bifidobacterium sp. SO1 TaxID=2809029 RepID=UPI001BDDB0D0|nr:DUF6364 family protein [Bifidobacterium sp. SO1]MBT1160906.1 toxin-antitoxin system protein [Bifidobacterium sp. SO1]
MSKLTLSIDEQVIENGKKYARKQGRTLSSIVEDYLQTLGSETSGANLSSPVRALMGIGSGPADENDYKRHLLERNR